METKESNRRQTTDHGLQAVHGPQLTYLNFKTYFLSVLVTKRIIRSPFMG
jgi:hypothetical protein